MAAVVRPVAVKIALTKFGNLVDLGLGNVKNVSRAFPSAAPDDYNCATGIVLRYDFIAPCVFAQTRKQKKNGVCPCSRPQPATSRTSRPSPIR